MKQLISIRILLSFSAAFILVAALCYFFPRPLIDKTLPLLTLPISVIHPGMKLQTSLDGKNVILLQAVAVEKKRVGYKIQTVESSFKIRQDLGTIFGTPIMFFPLLFAWPGVPLRFRLKAAAWTFPLLLLIIMTDLSLTFLLEIEKRLVASSVITQTLSFIAQGLNAGGRQFLGLALFGVAMAPRFLKKMQYTPGPSPERNDPCPCGSGKKYKNCCMR